MDGEGWKVEVEVGEREGRREGRKSQRVIAGRVPSVSSGPMGEGQVESHGLAQRIIQHVVQESSSCPRPLPCCRLGFAPHFTEVAARKPGSLAREVEPVLHPRFKAPLLVEYDVATGSLMIPP